MDDFIASRYARKPHTAGLDIAVALPRDFSDGGIALAAVAAADTGQAS